MSKKSDLFAKEVSDEFAVLPIGKRNVNFFKRAFKDFEKQIRADQHRKTMEICHEAIHNAGLIDGVINVPK